MTHNLARINQWFRRVGEHILRLRWGIVLGVIIIDILAVIGIRNIEIDISTESWFLEDDPLVAATREFEAIFGNAEYVGILVEAEDVFAPDVLHMIRELGDELEATVPFADEVVSLANFEFTRGTAEGVEIENLVPEDIPSDPAAIEAIRQQAFSKDFLINRLFSDDSTQAWISLRLKTYPDDHGTTLAELPYMLVGQKIVAEILRQEKYAAYTLLPAGAPIVNYEAEIFFGQEANTLMALACGVGLIVLFAFLRSIRATLIAMITAVSAIVWVFGAMGYLGVKVDSIIITIPVFVGLAVSIGYAIHIFNLFERGFRLTETRRDAVLYAIAETGWPMFFTAATTIGALLSFFFVPIRQVRWMGLSAAAVVLATYLIVMTFTPAMLSFTLSKVRQSGHRGPANLRFDRFFTHLSRWIQRRARPIMIVCVLLILFFLGGLTQVYVSSDFTKTVGLKIPYIQRANYIGRSKIGAIDSYNATLTFAQAGAAKDPQVLRNFDLFSSEIAQLPLVKRVSSLLDVIKDLNQIMHADEASAPDDNAFYRIPDSGDFIAQLLLLYEMANGTEQENWVDYEYTTLRLMVETRDFDTAELEREFRVIRQRAAELFPEARFGMVGEAVQGAVAQNYIAKGEIVSFLIALGVIGLLMMLVFQSIKTGFIGMLPNIAPVIVVGGLMGYLEIPLEMTTMMIIPMLLGLAVDDTIHFITHCKAEFQRSGKYQQSLDYTFRTVGKAMFMTSFILIAIFCVYLTSIARFFTNLSILAMSGIASALLADYFITPILVSWSKPYGPEK